MGRIFLSYAREDRSLVEALARVLEASGHNVWWDRRLDGGEEFAAEIEEALAKAEAVVVAWSKISTKSRWVRDEAAVGGDSGKLVPVSIDGALPPLGFRQFHTLDLSGWKGGKRDERTDELLHSIERRLASTPPESPAAPVTTQQRMSLRRRWIGRTAVAFVVLLAVGTAGVLLKKREALANRSSPPVIALLPFAATSSDPAVRDAASQARESVAHAFSDSGVPVRLTESMPQTGSSEDYVMTGEIGGSAQKLLATVQMEDAAHHITIWSRHFEAAGDDAANLPDRMGAQVAGTLSWAGALRSLERRDPQLTAEALRQNDLTGDPLRNYEVAQRLAAETPNWGMAQLDFAMDTSFALDQLPRDQRAGAVDAARRASDRAKALQPNFGDVYIPWCVLHSSVRAMECEDRLRAGLRADPDAPFLNFFLSNLLREVGRFQEAFQLASLAHSHDPYMPEKIKALVRTSEIVGESAQAESLYKQGMRWWPGFDFSFARVSGILDRGGLRALEALPQESGTGDLWSGGKIRDLLDGLRSNSPTLLKRSCAQAARSFFAVACMLAFADGGDLDDAYALADQLYPQRVGRTPAEEEQLWLDDPAPLSREFITSAAASPMRRDPRYLQLAQRVGLLDYWRSGRLPDFCRAPHPEPICAKILRP